MPRTDCPAWNMLMGRIGLKLSLPHCWQDLRSSFDLINHAALCNKPVSILALLYLVICGQPSQLETFCNTYSIDCDMQTKALILIASDAGEARKSDRLKARIAVRAEPPKQLASVDAFEVDKDEGISFLIERGLLCEALQVALLSEHNLNILLQTIATVPELIAPFARVSCQIIDTSRPSIVAWSRTDPNASKLLHSIDICKREFLSAIRRLQQYPWSETEAVIESLERLLHANLPSVGVTNALFQPSALRMPQRRSINFGLPKEFDLCIPLRVPSVTAPVVDIPLRPPTPTVPIERSESPVKGKSLAKVSVHQPKAPSRLAEQVQVSDASLTESPATVTSVDLREFLSATPATRSSPRKSALSSPRSPTRTSPRSTPNSPSRLKEITVSAKRASPPRSSKQSPCVHASAYTKVPPSSPVTVSPMMGGNVTVRRQRKVSSTARPLAPSDLSSQSASPGTEVPAPTTRQKNSRALKAHDVSPGSPGYSFRDSTIKQRTPHKEEATVETPSKRRLGLPPSKKLFPEAEASSLPASNVKKKRSGHRGEK